MIQTEIDFLPHTRENNSFSESILNSNKESIKSNCKIVYDLLMEGKRLTVNGIVRSHNISSLPRRIADLEAKGIKVDRDLINGRFVEYYLKDKQ